MNVTFRLPTEELEKAFDKEATAAGLDGLKGHRSVGGMRASIYNAFPGRGRRRARAVHARVRAHAADRLDVRVRPLARATVEPARSDDRTLSASSSSAAETTGGRASASPAPASAGAADGRPRSPRRPPRLRSARAASTKPRQCSSDLRRLAVDLQPGERFAEGAPVHQRAARARRQLRVEQPALQAEDLPQPLDVAPRQRQQPERDARLLLHVVGPPRRVVTALAAVTRAASAAIRAGWRW